MNTSELVILGDQLRSNKMDNILKGNVVSSKNIEFLKTRPDITAKLLALQGERNINYLTKTKTKIFIWYDDVADFKANVAKDFNEFFQHIADNNTDKLVYRTPIIIFDPEDVVVSDNPTQINYGLSVYRSFSVLRRLSLLDKLEGYKFIMLLTYLIDKDKFTNTDDDIFEELKRKSGSKIRLKELKRENTEKQIEARTLKELNDLFGESDLSLKQIKQKLNTSFVDYDDWFEEYKKYYEESSDDDKNLATSYIYLKNKGSERAKSLLIDISNKYLTVMLMKMPNITKASKYQEKIENERNIIDNIIERLQTYTSSLYDVSITKSKSKIKSLKISISKLTRSLELHNLKLRTLLGFEEINESELNKLKNNVAKYINKSIKDGLAPNEFINYVDEVYKDYSENTRNDIKLIVYKTISE